MKLSDFIDTDVEDIVIQFLHMIKESTPTFVVQCWYENSEIKDDDIDKFRNKHIKQLDVIEMTFNRLEFHETAIWYDIIKSTDVDKLSHYKFRSTYENINDMINCIIEFSTVIKFDHQKNTGYNKNGSYRNAKDSNNRFKKMGRQS